MVVGPEPHARQGVHRERGGPHGREVASPARRHTGGTPAAGVPGTQRRDGDACSRARDLGGGGPRASLGGGPQRGDRAAGERLPVYPRPCPGSRLFPHPGGKTRPGTSPHWAAACRTYSSREAGGGDLRDRQSTEPRRRADHRTRRARATGGAQPECGQTGQGVDGLRLSPQLSGRWYGIVGGRRVGASAGAHVRAGVAPGGMRVPDRRTGGCGGAVEVGLTYLRHLGVEWPPHPTEEETRREYERTWALLGSREIEELIDLPVMSDPVSLATLDVLTKVATPALYAGYENLFSLAACRVVNLSLEHGNTDASCHGYVMAAAVAGPRFGDYPAGFRFGRLACDLVDQRGLQRFKARTYVVFGNLIMPWTKHVRTGRDLVRRAFDVANAIGDLTFATLSYNNLITNLLAAGDPLVDVQREAKEGLEFAEKGRFGFAVDRFAVQLGLIRTLRGLTPIFGCFNDERFDELHFERHLSSNPMLALPKCWYWIRKLQARFFAGDYVSAVEASLAAQGLLWTSLSYFETAEAHFYGALSHAAACDAALPAQYLQHVQALTAHHRQLLAWAEHGAENFANRATLVGA